MLTLTRVLLAPVFAFFFITGYKQGCTQSVSWIWICAGLALLIEISDIFDGRIARARKEVTNFGKIFDPVADSLSRQTIFISFMVAGIIPWWLYLVFFYRDTFMQLLRIVCASGGLVLAARKSGKLKAVLQGASTFIVLALVALPLYHVAWMPEKIWGYHPAFWVMAVPAIFTIVTVVDYIVPNILLIRKMLAMKS